MLQRLPIALSQVKAGNISAKCYLYRAKETTKKLLKYSGLNKIIKQNAYYIHNF